MHAIPLEFSRKFDCTIQVQLNIDRLLCIEKIPKFIYKELIKKKTIFPEKSYLWHQENLQINISRENFISIIVSNNKCILNNKFKDFQFRLTHNSLVTNIHLKKWGILNEENCTFCQKYPETVMHLLIDCFYSDKIWKLLFQFIEEVSGVYIRPRKEEIILGIHHIDLSGFYNSVMAIAKQYIYASRCLKRKPCISVLIKKIRFERKLEYLLAIQKNKLYEWSNKWILFESLDID